MSKKFLIVLSSLCMIIVYLSSPLALCSVMAQEQNTTNTTIELENGYAAQSNWFTLMRYLINTLFLKTEMNIH